MVQVKLGHLCECLVVAELHCQPYYCDVSWDRSENRAELGCFMLETVGKDGDDERGAAQLMVWRKLGSLEGPLQ